ncbi:MAG: ABC transporter permease [Candidatus Parvarchaeota archaeon]
MITRGYVIRRAIYTAITFYVAVTLVFLLPRLAPGNPVLIILLTKYGGIVKPQQLKILESELHIKGTLWQQYIGFWGSLLHGNLGPSFYYYPQSVSSLIATHLPWTFFLLGTSTVISIVLGVAVGSYSGWKRGYTDSFLQSFSIGLTAVPYLLLALIFQLVFAVLLVIN